MNTINGLLDVIDDPPLDMDSSSFGVILRRVVFAKNL